MSSSQLFDIAMNNVEDRVANEGRRETIYPVPHMQFCSIISAATVVRRRDYSTGVLCNIWFPPETHPELKSCKTFYAHDLLCIHSFVLKFCTEHGGIPAVLSAKFQNDCISETDVMDKRVFSRFEFKMSFERLSYIAQHHRSLWSATRVDGLRWCGSANH